MKIKKEKNDSIFIEVVSLVKNSGIVSFPKIMRHFQIGYARARRLLNELEKAKIIQTIKSDTDSIKILIKCKNDSSVWQNPGNK